MPQIPAPTAADDPFEAIAAKLAEVSPPADVMGRTIADLREKINLAIDPMAALSAKIDALGKTSREAGGASDDASRHAKSFSDHLRGIGHAISRGNLGGAIAQLGPAIGSLGTSLAKTAGVAVMAPAAIVAVGAAIQALVAKTNPAVAFQFNRALDDLAGTLGQILTPVLQGITVFIRQFADGMQGLKPAFEPIMTGIGQIIAALGPLAQSLMELAGPAIQLFGSLLQNIVVPVVQMAADALNFFVKGLQDVIETISLGLISFDEFKAKSSVNAAIRPAAYSQDIEAIGKRTTLAALNTSDRNNVPSLINKSNDLLAKILEKIGVPQGRTQQVSKHAKDILFGSPVGWVVKQLRDL